MRGVTRKELMERFARLQSMTTIGRLRYYTWEFMDTPQVSTFPRLGQAVSMLILVTITVSVITFIVASTPTGGCRWRAGMRVCPDSGGERLGNEPAMAALEMACVMIFSVE
jgi:hypothetical protein